MIVAVVSDTHLPRGSRRLPEECLERIRAADAVVHAGDFVRLEVLEQLRTLNERIEAVHGNVDDASLRVELPERSDVAVGAVRIGVVHDPGPRAGRPERLLSWFPACAAVVYGHTHLPEVTRHDGRWILNPGSPTERRRAPIHSMLELRIDGATVTPQLIALPT